MLLEDDMLGWRIVMKIAFCHTLWFFELIHITLFLIVAHSLAS
jgi:hypothetical protein